MEEVGEAVALGHRGDVTSWRVLQAGELGFGAKKSSALRTISGEPYSAEASEAPTSKGFFLAMRGKEAKYYVMTGDLVLKREVVREWADKLGSARSRVLSIPSRLKQDRPHLQPADAAHAEHLVREAREAAASGE